MHSAAFNSSDRVATCVLVLLLTTVGSMSPSRANPEDCRLKKTSDLFLGLDTSPDWKHYRQMVEQSMVRDRARETFFKTCPNGPADAESRAVLFSYFSQEVEFLDALRNAPSRNSADCGECEAFIYQADTLRKALAQVADPARDVAWVRVVARVGDAETMARFGPAIEGDVRLLLDGDVYRDRTRALETLGLWLSPSESRFSSEEKSAFRDLLVAALPRPAVSMVGNPYFLANSALKGLGHATDVESEKAVQEWLDWYDALGLGPNDTLARSARKSLQSIRKNRERPIEK